MALTEPQAGSSLADVHDARDADRATGTTSIRGSKIFISGGDHDLTDNIVHMTLARIDGAPPGIKGVSLFCVPKRRARGRRARRQRRRGRRRDPQDRLARAAEPRAQLRRARRLPRLARRRAAPGHPLHVPDDERGAHHGRPERRRHRVGRVPRGARLRARRARRAARSARRDPAAPQVPIIEHADVRRMLLRQKAIVEGGARAARRTRAATPISPRTPRRRRARSARGCCSICSRRSPSRFPAERGFEANALAVQIHGGYGYSSEYLPEAWLRDQKLNTHPRRHDRHPEPRPARPQGGRRRRRGARRRSSEEVAATLARARQGRRRARHRRRRARRSAPLGAVTLELARRGLAGDRERMMLHASTTWTSSPRWRWRGSGSSRRRRRGKGCAGGDEPFYRGKLAAAQYWIRAELPADGAPGRALPHRRGLLRLGAGGLVLTC